MKNIVFKYFLFAACGVFLAGCGSDKSKDSTSWKCVKVFSQNKVLCQKGKQAVAVTLAGLLVPGATDLKGKDYIFESSLCSSSVYEKCSKEALECVAELALNQPVKIVPEPAPGAKKLAAQVITSRGSDVAKTLLLEGLAIAEKTNSPGSYSRYQSRAMNLERGLWKSSKMHGDIFAVKSNVEITVGKDKDQKKRTVKGLRRFHSPDLIRAPLLEDADTSKEEKSFVLINCKAAISIKIKPPPKEYELTVMFRPLARVNIYSGPLDSFKKDDLKWEEEFINAKGGDYIKAELEYEILELNLVTRSGTKVYSGYIVEGYELKILANEETIFRKTEEYSDKEVLDKLEKSEAVFF